MVVEVRGSKKLYNDNDDAYIYLIKIKKNFYIEIIKIINFLQKAILLKKFI